MRSILDEERAYANPESKSTAPAAVYDEDDKKGQNASRSSLCAGFNTDLHKAKPGSQTPATGGFEECPA